MRIRTGFAKALITLGLYILMGCGEEGPLTRETYWDNSRIKERYEVLISEDSVEIKHGAYLSWYESGNFHVNGRYVNGLEAGTWIYWHDTDDSAKLMEGRFVDGGMDGPWQYWMPPGHHAGQHSMPMPHRTDSQRDSSAAPSRPDKIANFSKGVSHGLSISWHHSGQVADSMTYRNGKLHGLYVSYHANGTRAAQAVYSDGVLVDPMKMWDSLGQPVASD